MLDDLGRPKRIELVDLGSGEPEREPLPAPRMKKVSEKKESVMDVPGEPVPVPVMSESVKKLVEGPLVDVGAPPKFQAYDADPKGRFRLDRNEDMFVPQCTKNSWIADYLLATRGFETPTFITLWSALWTLSTGTARCMHLKWIREKPLFPNLYVIVVAPPGRCKKSTAAEWGEDLLARMKDEIFTDKESFEHQVMGFTTDFNWILNKATSDAMLHVMQPKTQTVTRGNKVVFIKKGSHVSMCISELATFLNKKKYNTGMVDMLTDLYDCKARSNIVTLTRGEEKIEEVYSTLFGATTPDGLRMSIPEEAFGEGFMSRVVTVFSSHSDRRFPVPLEFEGLPTSDDIRERLAWILMKGRGEYTLSPEGLAWYTEWYDNWRDIIDQDNPEDVTGQAEYRFDIMMLKIATLLRLSEYTIGNEIEARHLQDAEKLLRYTASQAKGVLMNAVEKEEDKYLRIVRNFLMNHRPCKRRVLIQKMSPKHIKVPEVNDALNELIQQGELLVKRSGNVFTNITTDGAEEYSWQEVAPGDLSD